MIRDPDMSLNLKVVVGAPALREESTGGAGWSDDPDSGAKSGLEAGNSGRSSLGDDVFLGQAGRPRSDVSTVPAAKSSGCGKDFFGVYPKSQQQFAKEVAKMAKEVA